MWMSQGKSSESTTKQKSLSIFSSTNKLHLNTKAPFQARHSIEQVRRLQKFMDRGLTKYSTRQFQRAALSFYGSKED